MIRARTTIIFPVIRRCYTTNKSFSGNLGQAQLSSDDINKAIDDINDEITGVFKHHVDERELSIDPIRGNKNSIKNESMTLFSDSMNGGLNHHDTKLPFQVPLPPPNSTSTISSLHTNTQNASSGAAPLSQSSTADYATVILRLNLIETKMDLLSTKLDLVLSELRHVKGK